MFKNLKIGSRLIICFIIILAGLIGVSVFSVFSLNNILAADTNMYDQDLLGIATLGNITKDYYSLRVAVLKTVYMNFGPDAANALADSLSSTKLDIDKQISDYQATIVSQQDQKDLDTLKPYLSDYLTETSKIAGLVKAGDKQAAENEVSNLSSIAVNVTGQLDNMIKSSQDQASLKKASNISLGNFSTLLMYIVAAAVGGLAVFLAVIVTKSITKPVSRLMATADRLAEGDVNITVDADSKDEIGMLSRSFGKVVEALQMLVTDANTLSDAALDGKLSARADASAHRGVYRQMIEGVNKTLDALIEPVNEAANVLYEFAQGNLNVNVAGNYKGDHAAIKNALNDTINTVKSYINEISDVLAKMARGDMTQEITAEYRGAFNNLKTSINEIIDSLNTMLLEINRTASQVSTGTKQVSDGSQTLAQGASEQASSIEELSASVIQISAQTEQNAINASEANNFAAAVKNAAIKGNETMKNMLLSMDEINESSSSISKIIKVIDEIAFQTNILALNAAVEAARAGTHGKGFAVVAEEVRNLAAKSANAAKETTKMIEGSIKNVEQGTRLANETACACEEIVESANKAVSLIAEIAIASGQQATAISQINQGIEQVSSVTQGNSANAQQSAAASEELSGQAEVLKNLAGQFRLRSQGNGSGAKSFSDNPHHNYDSEDFRKY